MNNQLNNKRHSELLNSSSALSLQVFEIDVHMLKPMAKTARRHPRKQIKKLARSIQHFGFVTPLLIDETNTLIAGHGCLEAAKLLELKKVPCIRVGHLDAASKEALALALNKLALESEWDELLLADVLRDMQLSNPVLDLTLTGFDTAEIDGLLNGLPLDDLEDPRDDALPVTDNNSVVTREGDLWQLGPGRLVCGDARSRETMTLLMGGEQARLCFTDPPYNVKVQGHISGLGKIEHPEFIMGFGEMTTAEFIRLLTDAFRNTAAVLHDGALIYVCMDWRHMHDLYQAVAPVFTSFENLITWVKHSGGMGSLYRSQHELIFIFKKGKAPHINNVDLGKHGRNRTNVWHYRGLSGFGKDRDKLLAMHPTVKPVQMIADAILDVTNRNDIIVDTFGGSGSTLIAAHKTGRRGYLIELDPRYCDVTIRRWQEFARDDAILVATGQTFSEVMAERLKAKAA